MVLCTKEEKKSLNLPVYLIHTYTGMRIKLKSYHNVLFLKPYYLI